MEWIHFRTHATVMSRSASVCSYLQVTLGWPFPVGAIMTKRPISKRKQRTKNVHFLETLSFSEMHVFFSFYLALLPYYRHKIQKIRDFKPFPNSSLEMTFCKDLWWAFHLIVGHGLRGADFKGLLLVLAEFSFCWGRWAGRWAIILWGFKIFLIFRNFLRSKNLSSKSFGNLFDNSYIPCSQVIIAHLSLVMKRKFGETSKVSKCYEDDCS